MSWGRPVPENVNVVAHWGARAIFTNSDYIDLLPDRQSLTRPENRGGLYTDDRDPLINWVNKTGLPWLRKEAAQQFDSSSGERRTISFDDGKYHIEADPQGSYGYLYIGAWELA
jgi:hypothetical protein